MARDLIQNIAQPNEPEKQGKQEGTEISAEEAYKRLRWDTRFKQEDIVVVLSDGEITQHVPILKFNPSSRMRHF